MRFLLDTWVLLWWLDDSPVLSAEARGCISDGRNTVYVSAISIWEIVIKHALGKLEIPPNFREVVLAEPFQFLSVSAEHAFAVGELPDHHRDPFDRMLVAQCRVEGTTLVTRDADLRRYGVSILNA